MMTLTPPLSIARAQLRNPDTNSTQVLQGSTRFYRFYWVLPSSLGSTGFYWDHWVQFNQQNLGGRTLHEPRRNPAEPGRTPKTQQNAGFVEALSLAASSRMADTRHRRRYFVDTIRRSTARRRRPQKVRASSRPAPDGWAAGVEIGGARHCGRYCSPRLRWRRHTM